MTTLAINDLNLGKDLDRQAMGSLMGGKWTYQGSTYSQGSWTFSSSTTYFKGYVWVGGYLRKKYGKRVTYKRTQYRNDFYCCIV